MTTHDEAPDASPEQKEKEQQLIEQGKQLVKTMDTQQFRLGLVALEYAPILQRGGYRRGPGQQERTAQFAELIGTKPATIRQYRSVVHAWRDTDVKPDEFQWRILQQNVRVADKQAFIDKLRRLAPESNTRSWSPIPVKKMALDENLYGEAKGGRSPKSVTIDTKVKSLTTIASRLREMQCEPSDRERVEPLISQIQAECDRLRGQITEKDAATQVAEDVSKRVIEKERLLPGTEVNL